MQSTLNEPDTDAAWRRLAPLLDEALNQLGETDRAALVLRYFQNKTAREIAEALRMEEETAQKRVTRALEKLRAIFVKRGVTLTLTDIAETVAANSMKVAPAGLVMAVAATAKGAAVTTSITTIVNGTMNLLTWMKIKFVIGISASVLLVAGVATVAVSQTRGGDKTPPQKINSIQGMFSTQSSTETNTITSVVGNRPLTEALQEISGQLPKATPSRDEQLQKSFLQFPLLTSITDSNGQPAFQTLTLENPVVYAGQKYYGFRFKVPPRKNHEDFVWSFVQPETPSFTDWYILPQTGIMEAIPQPGLGQGFMNYFYCPKNIYSRADDLLPLNGRRLILQSLSGDNLDDGQTYLIWFGFKGKNPAQISLAFTFANLQTNKLDAIAKVLALNRRRYIEHPFSPPIVNPGNHHIYVLLRPATWEESEAEAVALGGHLATVRNQAEENWIFKTFGHYEGMQRLLWIGLSDREKKFHFSWASGESVSYTAWAKGEPNNAGRGEDYVSIYYPNHSQANLWNDWGDKVVDPIGLPMDGVVEIIPTETNNLASAAQSAAPMTANAGAVQISPNIVITSDRGSIKLQWPVSAASYMLETTTNLSQPFTMFGYSELTNIEDGVIYVTITNPVPQMFFRLQKP